MAGGPDGKCALCHRSERVRGEVQTRGGDRRIHRVLRVVIALIAFMTTYALLMALLDTTHAPAEGPQSHPRSQGPQPPTGPVTSPHP